VIPKFRAWLKKEQKMDNEIDHISWLEDELYCIGDGITYMVLAEDLVLMQSTGLKDKNGQEIFEGDIIQTSAFACIVGFGEYTYIGDRNTLETEIGFYLSFLNIKPATYAPFDKYYWDNCEVIGNIHENELDLIMYEVSKFNKEIEDET
jgi:uncharacterized phage protein (TIGR01671 family)